MALAIKVSDVSGQDTLTDAALNSQVLVRLNDHSGVLYLNVFEDDADGEVGIRLEAETEQGVLGSETLGPYATWDAATATAYAFKQYMEQTYPNVEVNAPDLADGSGFLPDAVKTWDIRLDSASRN